MLCPMADLSRHLPLSNRPTADESAVTSDRRQALAAVVGRAAELIARTDESGDSERAAAFLAEARLDREFAGTALPAVAEAIATGAARGIRPLTDAVRALLRLAGTEAVELDPVTSGAVALYAVTRAPFDRRAVVSGCTLRATDAEWEFGRGPPRAAPARQILEFLLGLGDVPPPLTSRR